MTDENKEFICNPFVLIGTKWFAVGEYFMEGKSYRELSLEDWDKEDTVVMVYMPPRAIWQRTILDIEIGVPSRRLTPLERLKLWRAALWLDWIPF